VTVSAGRLNVPNNLGAGDLTVADGATLGGEPTAVNTLTLGTSAGATPVIEPNTPGAIPASTHAVNGTRLIDPTATSYTVGNNATLGGSGSITLAASATIQVLVQAGGTLAPGNSPGILTILNTTPGTGAASTLALAANSTLNLELNGPAAGTQYD
jgi:hypothetical protein